MFFIIVDGIVTPIQLPDLESTSSKRVDKTLAKGETPRPITFNREKYAIEVMSKNVITKEHEVSVEEALKIFKTQKIHHLILTKDISVVGIVSDRDLLWVEKIHLSEHAMAKQFMAETILCCHEETPLDQIAKVMVKEAISALPVIDDKHELSGIITHHDLLKELF